MKPLIFAKGLFALGLGLSLTKDTVNAAKGAKVVKAFGYENCIELINKTPVWCSRKPADGCCLTK